MGYIKTHTHKHMQQQVQAFFRHVLVGGREGGGGRRGEGAGLLLACEVFTSLSSL